MTLTAPGLAASALCRITKKRALSLKGSVLVKEGDAVSSGDIIAEAQLPGEVHAVMCASLMGIDAAELDGYLKVGEGDRVIEGQKLAAVKTLFRKAGVASPVSGRVERISGATGTVLVRSDPRRIEVKAYISGTVTDIVPGYGAVVECTAAMVQGAYGTGSETTGRLVFVPAGEGALPAGRVTDEHAGCVLVTDGSVSVETVEAALKNKVHAVVCAGMKADDFHSVKDTDIVLFVTEGFGMMRMSKKIDGILRDNEGRSASVCGITRIRAGALRPEIIIPLDEELSAAERVSVPELAAGVEVRIVRGGFSGMTGTVSHLPVEPVKIATGAVVTVAVVMLEKNNSTEVPVANIEVI